ncbi:hypothetical protein D9611_013363 [Ephemerocybe angulata]|uniref:ARM repeat-containing protein n=1 Tax=Ephemerocybe angulata TaxID=980116 RepID=A0A8H5CBI4_9AGAR|nr:hypothetical protein D9611_013363 [Tulosesus angulatus]
MVKSPPNSLYAPNDSQAEKAAEEKRASQSTANAPLLPKSATIPRPPKFRKKVSSRSGVNGGRGRETDELIEFRQDAKIWLLYLEDAEEEAKERAEIWRTGLDSLLIFAGLFAGIVSSFVIDARQDIQEESNQRLLSDIRQVLLKGSIGEVAGIPVSSLWISSIWGVSLYTTLFGSIMGVLAKAWLAKFVPASTRREARDAFERYTLDLQAERWYLKEVLTLVPLLVQVASILFLAGLVLQSYGDSLTLGHIMAAFCLSGLLLYLTMTFIPLFLPSSPFDTPFSDLFLWLKDLLATLRHRQPPSESAYRVTDDINEGLADILYTKLIRSPKPQFVDEALAEVAHPDFGKKWIDYLCQNETPQILLQRFRQIATTPSSDIVQKNETLCNHLMALLRFVDLYEEKIQHHKKWGGSLEPYEVLDAVLHESLEPGNPLYRWNNLPEELRPLLSALRTQVLLLLPDPHLADIDPKELADRPWEMAFQDIRSGHRLHFKLAACRGLVQGKPNLKTISASILSVSLAKAATIAIETGRTSEWAGNSDGRDRQKVDSLALTYLSKLYEATVSGWESRVADAYLDAFPVPIGDDRSDMQADPSILKGLLGSLYQRGSMRNHALKMLTHLCETKPELFPGVVESSLPTIANIAVYDDDEDRTRNAAFILLGRLMSYSETLKAPIEEAVGLSIETGLADYYQLPMRVISFIRASTTFYFSSNPFIACIENAIPVIVKVATSDYTHAELSKSAKAILRTFSDNGLIDVKQPVLERLSSDLQFDGNDTWRASTLLSTLKDFATNTPASSEAAIESPQFSNLITFPWYSQNDFLSELIRLSFDRIVDIAIYEDTATTPQESAQALLELLASDARFNWRLKVDAIQLLETALVRPYRSFRVWLNCVHVLTALQPILGVGNPKLLKLLVELSATPEGEMDFGGTELRQASLTLLSSICKHRHVTVKGFEAMKAAVISIRHFIVEEEINDMIALWISFLGTLMKRSFFPAVIPVFLEIILKCQSRKIEMELEGIFESGESGNGTAYDDAITSAIPEDLRLTFDTRESWNETLKWAKALNALRWPELQASIRSRLGNALQDIKEAIEGKSDTWDRDYDEAEINAAENTNLGNSNLHSTLRKRLCRISENERLAWVEAVSIFAQHFPHDLQDVGPSVIMQLVLHDADGEIRSRSLDFLSPLGTMDELRACIMPLLTENLDALAFSEDWRIRSAYAITLGHLGCIETEQLPANVVNKLISMALEETDHDVRTDAVKSLEILCDNEGGYCDTICQEISAKLDGSTGNESWKASIWIKLVASRSKTVPFSQFPKLFDIAVENFNIGYDVQENGLELIQTLLRDATHRDSIASKLGAALTTSLRSTEYLNRAINVLSTLGLPKALVSDAPGDSPTIPDDHQAFVDAATILSRTEPQATPKIIETALKELVDDDFQSLYLLFQNIKLSEPIQTILPRAMEAALKSDQAFEIRMASVRLFKHIISGGQDPNANSYYMATAERLNYESLLGRAADAQLISRFTEFALRDPHFVLRDDAYSCLNMGFLNTRFRDLIKLSLSKAVEASLKDQDPGIRDNAISFVDKLTTPDPNSQDYQPSYDMHFRDVLSLSIPHLLKMVLLVNEGDEMLRNRIETVLLQRLSEYKAENKLTRDVMTAIPPIVTGITLAGKRIAFEIAETYAISDDTAASVAHALASTLRNTTSSFARATSIELLSIVYSKHRDTKPELIEFAIPEISALAMDEKDDVGGIRATAIRLLVALAGGSRCTPGAPLYNPVPYLSSAALGVLDQITPLAGRFMLLLKNETLRPSVVDLLSLMSEGSPAVRRMITMRMITSFLGTDNISLTGDVDLLAQMISDGRFTDDSTDYIMLLLASVIVTRPQFAQYRFEVLTALWCRYSSKSLQSDLYGSSIAVYKELLDLFTFALFGRHATEYEVSTWLVRCKAWLSGDSEDPEEESLEGQPPLPSDNVDNEVPLPSGNSVKSGATGLYIPPDDASSHIAKVEELRFDQTSPGFAAALVNNSPYPVYYDGESYPTATHLYEALKFLPSHPEIAQRIRETPNVLDVNLVAEECTEFQRDDWATISLKMLKVAIACKVNQHGDLMTYLESATGDKKLIFDDKSDAFLGVGPEGTGENQLGKRLEKVRTKLNEYWITAESDIEPESQVPLEVEEQKADVDGAAEGMTEEHVEGKTEDVAQERAQEPADKKVDENADYSPLDSAIA